MCYILIHVGDTQSSTTRELFIVTEKQRQTFRMRRFCSGFLHTLEYGTREVAVKYRINVYQVKYEPEKKQFANGEVARVNLEPMVLQSFVPSHNKCSRKQWRWLAIVNKYYGRQERGSEIYECGLSVSAFIRFSRSTRFILNKYYRYPLHVRKIHYRAR
jgi:hypothetical protein